MPISVPHHPREYWIRLGLFGVVAFLIEFLAVFEGVYVRAMILPAPASLCCHTPAEKNLRYEEVVFRSADGIALSGWYIPSRNRAAVILLHGYGANRLEVLFRATALAQNGFGVLLYDLRGHGQSGGSVRALGWPDTTDLVAAVNFVAAREEIDPERIGVFGFSIGGQIAIRTAVMDGRIRAVMADDPSYVSVDDLPSAGSVPEFIQVATTMLDIRLISIFSGVPVPEGMTTVLPRLAPRPFFLVMSGKDPLTRRLERHFFDLAGEPKELWEIPDAGHGEGFLLYSEEYSRRMAAFFSEALLR